MERYTLNDLEKLTGIKTATIRIWERRYRIIKPHRTETNRRWYDDEDLRRILNISILNKHDVKISAIAVMSGKEIEEKAAAILRGSSGSDVRIDSLLLAMVNLDEASVNDVLMRSVISSGFAETFSTVVFPFLKRVGDMWLTGSIDIGAEHFVTNLFRRRLISAIDSLPLPNHPQKKRVLMYLPEGELHEMPLLYYHFIVRKMGHEVIYLGPVTPLDSVVDVCNRWNPDIVVTGALTGLPFTSPSDYLKLLGQKLDHLTILVAGSLAGTANDLKIRNIFPVRADQDLIRYL